VFFATAAQPLGWLSDGRKQRGTANTELRTALPAVAIRRAGARLGFSLYARRRVKVDPSRTPAFNRPSRWRFCPSCFLRLPRTDERLLAQGVPTLRPQWLLPNQGQVKADGRLRQVQATQKMPAGARADDSDERKPPVLHRQLLILPDLSRREISLAI